MNAKLVAHREHAPGRRGGVALCVRYEERVAHGELYGQCQCGWVIRLQQRMREDLGDGWTLRWPAFETPPNQMLCGALVFACAGFVVEDAGQLVVRDGAPCEQPRAVVCVD